MNKRITVWMSIIILIMLVITACGPAVTIEPGEQETTHSEGDTDNAHGTEGDSEMSEEGEAAHQSGEAEAATDDSEEETQESDDAEASQSEEDTIAAESQGSEAIPADAGITTDSGLQYIELEEGTGTAANTGDFVEVHYTGKLEDGTVFDSSLDRGQPYRFPLGAGQVIPGWDEGVALMKEGGKATLVIPPELGYGAQGAGGVIPPNATLIFDVELISVTPAPKPEEIAAADYTTTDSGLQYYDMIEGEGDTPQEGDNLSMHFRAWIQEDSILLADSYDRGQPIHFPLGSDDVFEGWNEGVSTMKVGGKRQLIIPPELGFGNDPNSGIPADAILILEVELLDFSAPAKATEIDEADYEETATGLKYYDLVEGDGASPESGQTVIVHYTGWLTDGTQFDSSLDRGQPFTFVIGQGGVIAGWDEGVATMKIGGKRQLVIPAELGYGEQGTGGIPPNATLIFEVELLGVQ